jgi:hypothetical protein
LVKQALLQLSIEFEESKAFKNSLYMLVVVSLVVRIDKYVINIDDHTDVQEVTEDIVHQVLEGSRSISETK